MNQIIVIVGPSGSGKTHLSKELATHGIPKCITATTRSPRESEGEVDGRDYYFLSKSAFEATDFIETTTYHGNYYGLPVKEVTKKLEEAGIIHVVVEKNGAKALKKAFPNETKIIFLPITEERMHTRMLQRGDNPLQVEQRIIHANETGEFEPPEQVDFIYEVFGSSQLSDLLEFITQNN